MEGNAESEVPGSRTQSSGIVEEGYPHGVVIAGEASESDEEFLEVSLPVQLKTDVQKSSPSCADKPLLKFDVSTSRVKVSKVYGVKNPRFNSLLHQKLREKNEELGRYLRESLTSAYSSSAKRLFTISNSLSKSESALQDASNNMRLQTNDLFHLEEKLDIITTCHLLPDIKI